VCDNGAAIKACKRTCTQSVFHRTEEYYDLISTIHYLQDRWCQDIDIQYTWVKGHTDDLNRELKKHERMNILDDELCDVIWETVRGNLEQDPTVSFGKAKYVQYSSEA
jgi:hypothetical protein